jgi:hypothetical protein
MNTASGSIWMLDHVAGDVRPRAAEERTDAGHAPSEAMVLMGEA